MPPSSRPVPMISALALGPMPELVQSELGDKSLRRIFHASGLTSDLLYERAGYIPEPALVRFFVETARQAGERWILAPWVSQIKIRDYGTWGNWVLSAPTLGEALRRGSASIRLHGTHDILRLTVRDGLAEYSYQFAGVATPGYGELAIGGAAALMNYCREYLGREWVPARIELNLQGLSRRDRDALECWFQCPIGISEKAIRLVFDERLLNATRRPGTALALTYEDVVRERLESRPATLAAQVRSLVLRNLSDGLHGLDDTARSLDLAVRTLQQRLHVEGASYRELVKDARLTRAKELLKEGSLSVTEIAYELGYEYVGHFTRMFGTEVGIPPSVFAERSNSAGNGRF